VHAEKLAKGSGTPGFPRSTRRAGEGIAVEGVARNDLALPLVDETARTQIGEAAKPSAQPEAATATPEGPAPATAQTEEPPPGPPHDHVEATAERVVVLAVEEAPKPVAAGGAPEAAAPVAEEITSHVAIVPTRWSSRDCGRRAWKTRYRPCRLPSR